MRYLVFVEFCAFQIYFGMVSFRLWVVSLASARGTQQKPQSLLPSARGNQAQSQHALHDPFSSRGLASTVRRPGVLIRRLLRVYVVEVFLLLKPPKIGATGHGQSDTEQVAVGLIL